MSFRYGCQMQAGEFLENWGWSLEKGGVSGKGGTSAGLNATKSSLPKQLLFSRGTKSP